MRKISILLLLLAVEPFFYACKEGNASSKIKKEKIDMAKKRDQKVIKASAQIQFDSTEIDFGTVDEGEIVEAKFTVINAGKTDLVISNVQPSCGCTVPIWPKNPIKPGASSEVLANFNTSGKPNRQFKTLTLFANTPTGRHVLKLRGFVKPKNPVKTK